MVGRLEGTLPGPTRTDKASRRPTDRRSWRTVKPEPLPLSSLPLPLCPGQSTHLGPSLSQALLEHQWDLPEAAGAAEEPARPRREAAGVKMYSNQSHNKSQVNIYLSRTEVDRILSQSFFFFLSAVFFFFNFIFILYKIVLVLPNGRAR